MEFTDFEALTFDCYGTLIDWERGIVDAFANLSSGFQAPPIDDELLLAAFGRLEARAEKGAYRTYRRILEDVALGLGRAFELRVSPAQAAAFADSVRTWPPFPDSVPALRVLGARYRLAVVSNVDDDLFAASAAQLGSPFEHAVTAEQVRSYKPAHAHFHEVMARLALPPDRILHVAQSRYHDLEPAAQLGLRCVWVDRRRGRSGAGATPAAVAKPDLEVPDLAALVAEMRLV